MRFAVAATKIRGGFSCIQVRKAEKICELTSAPPSSMPREFSISSIHRMPGARDSMVRSARWKAASGEPKLPE